MSGRDQPHPLLSGARAAIGQGAMMGWGDEAEAWLRSKLGEGEYEDLVKRIRKEYGAYSERNPITSAVAEFGGGVVPGLAAMFVPGGQPAGAAQMGTAGATALSRLMNRPIAKSIAAGTATGAVSGAGSADEESRGAGAVTGGVMGGALGAAVPGAMRAAGNAREWLAERLFPSAQKAENRALSKISGALGESGITPAEIARRMTRDKKLGVPSTVANVDPALADLAETVAQRTGRGTRRVESEISKQQAGAKERTYQQAQRGLKPGDYYADEQKMVDDLRRNANSVYEQAYAVGEVNDPRINEVLKNPQFKGFYDKARKIAETEAQAAKLRGEDPSKYALPEIYTLEVDPVTKVMTPVVTKLPDVRTLDYIKRGIDATIDSGFRGQGMSTAEASALRDLRKVFVNAIDENVPEYAAARARYSGDMEVLDALRAGYNDFGKMDHEQIIGAVAKMSQAEKEAFRTGVVRDIYGRLFNSSRNMNAAALLEAPEMKAKLQPLFDSPAQFRLFEAAIERESQLFKQANQMLRGSQTGKRTTMREKFEDAGEGVTQAAARALTGGWMSSLTGTVSRALYKTTMTDEMADKLATMLMSKDPADVATVVRALEKYATDAAPKAAGIARREVGATTGAASMAPVAPMGEEPSSVSLEQSIDATEAEPTPGRSLAAEVEAENRRGEVTP